MLGSPIKSKRKISILISLVDGVSTFLLVLPDILLEKLQKPS